MRTWIITWFLVFPLIIYANTTAKTLEQEEEELLKEADAMSENLEVFGPDASLASPQAPPEPKKLELVEVFSAETNPGAGTLQFSTGIQKEELKFGAQGGLYGLGMLIKGAILPNRYGKKFKNDTIIQIALGRLKSKTANRIPQFGAATLIGGPKISSSKTIFPIMMPVKGKAHKDQNMALLLFSSPSTPANQSDEQKLKSTYFAKAGTLSVKKSGKTKTIKVQANGKNMWFKMHPVAIEMHLTLATPFNANQASLEGTIQIPLYAPHNETAKTFTRQIAGQSLKGSMTKKSPLNSSHKSQ